MLPGAGAALAVRASGPYTAPAPRCDLESLPPLQPQSSQQAVDAFELGWIQLQGSLRPQEGSWGRFPLHTHTGQASPPNLTMRVRVTSTEALSRVLLPESSTSSPAPPPPAREQGVPEPGAQGCQQQQRPKHTQ